MTIFGIFYREVVVGEYTIGEDPDCETCPPVQKFGVDKVILHENWDPNIAKKGFKKGFDIALVRLDGSIKLFSVSLVGISKEYIDSVFTSHNIYKMNYFCDYLS